MKRLECLDGLRGVLAVYVMLGHMAPFAAMPGWIIAPLSHGGAAVDVFFMLSGLVIVRSLESYGYKAKPFIISRFARIYPVYLVMLAAGTLVQSMPIDFDAMPWIDSASVAHDIWPDGWPANLTVEIAAHLTMTHGLFPNSVLPDAWVSFLGSAWSLSTEWQFYVLALLLGGLIRNRSPCGTSRLAAIFLYLGFAGLIWDMAAPPEWRFSRAFLLNKAQYFALGVASGAWVDKGAARSFLLVLGATLGVAAARGQMDKLLPPLIWTCCLAAQLYPDRLGIIAQPLRWRVTQFLGAISYPIYLVNEPIQKALCSVLDRLAAGEPAEFTLCWLPSAVGLPIVAAWGLHRFVEMPALRWGRDLARRGNQPLSANARATAASSRSDPRAPMIDSPTGAPSTIAPGRLT